MRFRNSAVLTAAVGLLAVACADDPATAPGNRPSFAATAAGSKTYVLTTTGSTVPADLAGRIAAIGGTVTASLNAAGVVIASGDAEFGTRAARLAGVQGVSEDVMLDFEVPRVGGEVEAGDADLSQQSHVGSAESFMPLQWAPGAISAPAAWHAGHMGLGARVAILDGGIYSAHVDIAPALDVARSASFVPGQAYNFDTGTFWHGTHVAGIVAAPANGLGTVGIAPQATIIGVKVLHSGSGSFSWVMQGIYYAATPIAEGGAGADIINMSLGAGIAGRDANTAHLLNALSRTTTYAYQRGAIVIAAAGNSGYDIDHTGNLVFVPAQSANVVAVAATGPMGWAQGATNFDRPASYTNYGQSAITLAGPGGDFALPGSALCTMPRNPSGTITRPCWVFDMVMAPCRGSGASISTYCWAAGTSMASPAVAGVAALITGKNGRMHPAQLEAALRQSADDLGKPGNDDFYGRGRVNAWRAVQ